MHNGQDQQELNQKKSETKPSESNGISIPLNLLNSNAPSLLHIPADVIKQNLVRDDDPETSLKLINKLSQTCKTLNRFFKSVKPIIVSKTLLNCVLKEKVELVLKLISQNPQCFFTKVKLEIGNDALEISPYQAFIETNLFNSKNTSLLIKVYRLPMWVKWAKANGAKEQKSELLQLKEQPTRYQNFTATLEAYRKQVSALQDGRLAQNLDQPDKKTCSR